MTISHTLSVLGFASLFLVGCSAPSTEVREGKGHTSSHLEDGESSGDESGADNGGESGTDNGGESGADNGGESGADNGGESEANNGGARGDGDAVPMSDDGTAAPAQPQSAYDKAMSAFGDAIAAGVPVEAYGPPMPGAPGTTDGQRAANVAVGIGKAAAGSLDRIGDAFNRANDAYGQGVSDCTVCF